MAIRARLVESFTIANNLLTPNIKTTDLKISPWATIEVTWNNFENPKDVL